MLSVCQLKKEMLSRVGHKPLRSYLQNQGLDNQGYCDPVEIYEDSPPHWKQKVDSVDSGDDEAGEEAKVIQEVLLAYDPPSL